MLSAILDESAGDYPDSHREILESVVTRGNVLLLSKRMAEVCNSTPSMWANIFVQIRNENNWSREKISPTIAHIDRQLTSSRTRGLRIAFNMPVSSATSDLGRRIFELLLCHRNRFKCLFFAGRPSCNGPFLCPQAVLTEFDFIRTTPSLTSVSIVKSDADKCCEATHQPLRIMPTHLARFKVPFPTLLPTSLGQQFNLPITHLDIDFQTSPTWAKILQSCGALHCLIYRAHNNLQEATTALPAVPSLRELHIFRLHHLPPLTAPNLRELTIADPNTGFSSDHLIRILGSRDAATLRSLDLLWNPISNLEIGSVLEECKSINILRLSSGRDSELRTEVYREMRNRVLAGYIRGGPTKMREVTFSSAPPSNSSAESARRAFASLARRGSELKGESVRFHQIVFRVRVLGCYGYFPPHIDAQEMVTFKRNNRYEHSLE